MAAGPRRDGLTPHPPLLRAHPGAGRSPPSPADPGGERCGRGGAHPRKGAPMNPADVVLVMVRRVCPDSVPPTALPTDTAAATHDTFDIRHVRPVPARQHAHPAGRLGDHRSGRVSARSRQSRARRPHDSGRGTTATGWALDRVGVRTGATGRWLSGHRTWTTPGVMAAEPWRRCSGTTPGRSDALVLCVALSPVVGGPRGRRGPAAGHEERAGPREPWPGNPAPLARPAATRRRSGSWRACGPVRWPGCFPACRRSTSWKAP